MEWSVNYFYYKLFLEKRNPLTKREAWVNVKVQNYLLNLKKKDLEVLEFGGGGSTLFFSDHCKLVHTIETDKEWVKKIKSKIIKPNVKFIDFVPNKEYDLILVDSGNDRIKEFEEAKKHLKKGGVILFDNIDRYKVNDKPKQILTDYASCYAGKTSTGIF